MNTDKILAEAIAKDYAPKENSKIVALKKLDKRAKLPATIFTYSWGIIFNPCWITYWHWKTTHNIRIQTINI